VKGFKDGIKDGGASVDGAPRPPPQVNANKANDSNTVDVEAKTSRDSPRMIDFGFDKIALIGAVALIVIGPEKLPRVARTVGHLIGKAQRYVADVKAEVNRSIELEDLKKMKTEFEDAARNVEPVGLGAQIHETRSELEKSWADADNGLLPNGAGMHETWTPAAARVQAPEEELAPEARRDAASGTSSAPACA